MYKNDITYLIETSIARGYTGIMEPTCNSVKLTLVKKTRYPANKYIIPETKLDKVNLRNYLERCYLNKIDPRTGAPLTEEQKLLFKKHVQNSSKLRLSMTDYIYQYEVNTRICLLYQRLNEEDKF